MSLMRWGRIAVSGMLFAGILAACGEPADTNIGTFKGLPAPPVAGGGAAGGNALVVDAASGATLKFAQETLSASTGTLQVTFNNPGDVPHNWTLVKPEEADQAANDAVGNAPDYKAPQAIGHTKTISKGGTDTISFEVAAAGTYTYICTFPGHYAAGMKGTLTVAEGAGGGAAAGPGTPLVSDSADAATLKFAQETLTVKAGNVSLTFNNKGALPHNWALVKQGDEQKEADAAIANAPDYKAAGAIAQTKTINGGTADTVSFTVEAGTYSFICTFPGHYAAGMKGTLTVEP
ncbi:MAG TPA: plastocyanin/azurin family copper-binding protein [Herpetosiphonaceae bacterium]